MTPSFFLKSANSDKPTSVIFFLTIPGERKPLRRSTGKLIDPALWSVKEQRATGNTKESREVNKIIDNITDSLPGVISDCRRNNKVVSSSDISAMLDPILQKKRITTAKTSIPVSVLDMFAWFADIIQQMKDGKILTPGRKKKIYSAETIKHFASASNIVRKFFTEKKLPRSFDIVTMETYGEFIGWCHARNYADNTIGSLIKRWKGLATLARKKGAHSNMIFEDDEFVIIKEETPDIWLDDHKIDKLAAQECPAPHYEIARDWFILDCDLGLRISDLRRVAVKDFTGRVFRLVNQKTGAYVSIPISGRVRKIIKRYKGLPPPMTDVNLNKYIKVVAKMAGLKNKFVYVVTKGGITQKEEYQEWEWVSSHTCRRSFITRLLRIKKPEPIPHTYIMKLAGIKRYETLMRYFKETAEDIAENMAGHAFFK